MIAYLFLFHMVHWSFISGQGWLLGNHFCKACQIFVKHVALLWKLPPPPPMPLCSSNNNLDHNSFDMFYKTDSCAIHGRIQMKNVPNESRTIMLDHALKSVAYLDFEKFGVKLWFLCFLTLYFVSCSEFFPPCLQCIWPVLYWFGGKLWEQYYDRTLEVPARL